VGGGLDVAGDQPQQVALLEHPWQQLFDAVEDPVLVGAGHGLVQVLDASLRNLGELGRVGSRPSTAVNGRNPTSGSVMPVSVHSPMSAGMP
jgi:hypothetical protein